MDIGTNIIEWYPFEENAEILEIYNETSILEKLNKKTVLHKISINEAKSIEGQFDYITLIGTYEYAPTIFEGEKPYSTFLKILKEHLKPKGKILIAIDNRLGIKYYVGAKSQHYQRIFEGLESEIRNGKPNLLIKREIEKYIKEAEFVDYKFYYPLSDYKFTNSIFTDELLPKSNHSKILYPVSYEKDSLILYNEINAMKQICDNGKFTDFTNSYLIELSNEEIKNDIKFVNYNIFRKDKYKLTLIMKKDTVEKYATTNEAKEHIKNIKRYIKHLESLGFSIIDKVENERIISKIIESDELDKKIVTKIKEEKIEEAYIEIEKWYSYIKERLEKEQKDGMDVFEKYQISVPSDTKEKMQFVKNGFIDLSFENVFYEDDYLFYDQEWYFENVPLEFILYRAINNIYTYNSSKIEPKLKKEKMLSDFNLQELCPYFEELERHIQKEILNEEEIQRYRNTVGKYFKNLETLNSDCQNLKQENKNLKQEIEEVYNQKNMIAEKYREIMEEHNELLQEYNTSRGWKIIKRFRKIFGKES